MGTGIGLNMVTCQRCKAKPFKVDVTMTTKTCCFKGLPIQRAFNYHFSYFFFLFFFKVSMEESMIEKVERQELSDADDTASGTDWMLQRDHQSLMHCLQHRKRRHPDLKGTFRLQSFLYTLDWL